MGGQKTRRLGSLCRIYKNSASKIIALESVEITADWVDLPNHQFFRSINSVNVARQLVHLTVGGSRVIASVQIMGDYSSIEENGGNFLVATWNKKSDDENDVVVSLEDYVGVIGDTV